jgi:hypothetical protein
VDLVTRDAGQVLSQINESQATCKEETDADSAASSGGEGKYTIHVTFPSSLPEAVLQLFNFVFYY